MVFLSDRIKYLTMTDASKVWMPDTFFRWVKSWINDLNFYLLLLLQIHANKLMSKNQFSQFSDTLCGNTCCEQISISGMRRSEVSTTSCSRTFTSGSSPMAWFSTASGLNIIQQIHIIFKMEVFECLPYIMEQWYIWTIPENNSCPQKAFWNTFLSCLFLKIKFFPGTHISTYFLIFHIYFPLWHFQVRSRPESWYSDSVFSWQSRSLNKP